MKKRTVLIVDDQMVNRSILGKMLSSEYAVAYAENGKAALDYLKANTETAAVILDIMMPIMDGYEVLNVMQDDRVLSKIPVIVSSQNNGEDDEVKALSLGAYDFIAKPYKADIIRHRLKNMIHFRETAAMVNKTQKDELTSLYNKQFFLEKAKQTLDENPTLSYDLICMGVEKFKLINDNYGVKKGDEVLSFIASCLRAFAGQDGLCGRFTGDEFYMLLLHDETDQEEKFHQLYHKINMVDMPMSIVLHTGIYVVDERTDTTINNACDRAKLAADENRGKYDEAVSYYDDRIRQNLIEEQFIISQMHRAIREKQFVVYYQPKYDLNVEKVAGAEALVRWIHPEKGFLSPGAFIPLFEKNGFISELDYYVWENVCSDMHTWISKGNTPVSISVNVSRNDIYDSEIVSKIVGLADKYKIPRKYLHLEITESAYTDNSNQLVEKVKQLREHGFIIEMDDFGSGYSSLNMLADMPVDILKLDMKFAEMEAKNASGKGIMSFVISLAKWLKLTVIAEGVETGEQISDLRQMDCNYVQGFYFAKPMPLDQFEELLSGADVTDMLSREDLEDSLCETLDTDMQNEIKKDRQILIVDDIALNRAVLSAAFINTYDVVEKENGQEALEYLLEHEKKVEIILLDLLMPVMDGFQLLKKIRTTPSLKDIPVIITSQSSEESEHRALKLGADDFVAKPYKPELILHRVKNVVDSHKYRTMEKDKINIQTKRD